MKNKKTILVTGAAGSVGLETIKELTKRAEKYQIIAFDQNLRSTRKKLAPYCQKIKMVLGNLNDEDLINQVTQDIDGVIHLAAIIPPKADQYPELTRAVNVIGTKSLINAVEKNAPQAFFIFTSSVSVYGDRLSHPWISVNDPLTPSQGDEYAQTKISAEELIRNSRLRWTIFRLSAIMGPQTRMDPLMFHMPLDTRIEIATARDTGFALTEAISHQDPLLGNTFNLAGGPGCRVLYHDFMSRIFIIMGLGNFDFPDHTFAEKNFHCGYFNDSDLLNDILHFQRDRIEDYYKTLKEKQHPWLHWATKLLRNPIKIALLRKSEPRNAFKRQHISKIQRFFLQKKKEVLNTPLTRI